MLIASWNLTYKPDFCPEFWDWIDDGYAHEIFFSIDKVRDELLAGSPPAAFAKWVRRDSKKSFYLDSLVGMQRWQALSDWARDPKLQFKEAAKTKFLDVKSADAWLIAFAAHAGNFDIVQTRNPNPLARKISSCPMPQGRSAFKRCCCMSCSQGTRGHIFALESDRFLGPLFV